MEGWRVLTSRRLLERRWLTIFEQHVALPTGVEIEEFHLVDAPDWVAILALTETGDVLLVDQYRHGLGGVSRELPAGVIDEGEAPLQTAQRELLEETGYEAPEWCPLLSVATEPSRHTNTAHFFLARGARRVAEPQGDVDEHIEVTSCSPQALLDAVDAGRIAHGIHIAAILTAHRRGWLVSGP
ncbi:MAG: NUDIX hydrolase [Deltaproteobacteria bacterium]|nr:NUDIX hydrolase [Deltaproteobacteria bacterium]